MRELPPTLSSLPLTSYDNSAYVFAQLKQVPKPPSRSGLTARRTAAERSKPSIPADSFMLAHVKQQQAARPRGGYTFSPQPKGYEGGAAHLPADAFMFSHIKSAPRATTLNHGAQGMGRVGLPGEYASKRDNAGDFLARLEAVRTAIETPPIPHS